MVCEVEVQDIKDAFNDFEEAAADQHEAEQNLEEERGFWEEETAGSGAGGLVIVGSIIAGVLTGGVGGLIVGGLGTLAGGGTIVYSESDRQDDIAAAERQLRDANRAMEKAERTWNKSMGALCRCLAAQSR